MSKKNKIEVKKCIYVQVDTYQTNGSDYEDPTPGKCFSGYNHEIIHIRSAGPVFFSKEGIDCHSQCADDYDKDVAWDNLQDCQAYVVLSRYSSAETFGRTEGCFTIEFVTNDIQQAKNWAKNNYEKIKKRYTGGMDRFESLDCETTNFVSDKKNILKKENWWEWYFPNFFFQNHPFFLALLLDN